MGEITGAFSNDHCISFFCTVSNPFVLHYSAISAATAKYNKMDDEVEVGDYFEFIQNDCAEPEVDETGSYIETNNGSF